jgi:diadenosine tetraphosphatase ApaH/serine/threonine PP2A family protein phosphatase
VPALEAVLPEVQAAGVDRIVVGGDVFPGPTPHVALERLLDCGVPVDFIYGNGEVAILEQLASKLPARVPEAYRPLIRWNAEQLSAAQRQLLANWPATLRLQLPALGEVLFCHATPRNENEIFTQVTAEDRLLPIFDAAKASLVVCGHTHMQFDRMVGTTRVVNAGSVGMPFGPAGADWLILGADVELRHTTYDLHAAAERIRHSGYPAAETFATQYVLQPPSTADTLALYSQHELK